MNIENSKTNQIHKFNYTWKNIRQQYKNNTLKETTATWNDEFELPDGPYLVSDIQYYIRYIIQSMKN